MHAHSGRARCSHRLASGCAQIARTAVLVLRRAHRAGHRRRLSAPDHGLSRRRRSRLRARQSRPALVRLADASARRAARAYGPYSVAAVAAQGRRPDSGRRSRPSIPTRRASPSGAPSRVTTDIRHGGGEGAIAQGSRDYASLKQWIDGGYTQQRRAGARRRNEPRPCVFARAGPRPRHRSHDAPPNDPTSFERSSRERAAGAGRAAAPARAVTATRIADLYLSCGDDEPSSAGTTRSRCATSTSRRSDLRAAAPPARACAPAASFHEGGDIFGDTEDPDYRKILAWANDIGQARARSCSQFSEADEKACASSPIACSRLLVRKGCMFLGCHSPAMFHDLRLRGGCARRLLRGRDAPQLRDVARDAGARIARPEHSRLIAKNLCPPSARWPRRAAPRRRVVRRLRRLCATPHARVRSTSARASTPTRGDLNEVPAYCVLARWHAIERAAGDRARRARRAQPRRSASCSSRGPPGIGGRRRFDTFRPGADLVLADAPHGRQAARRARRDALAARRLRLARPRRRARAGGVVGRQARSRSPRARRRSAAAHVPDERDGSDARSGARSTPRGRARRHPVHDFDPAYAPDGRLVFASTRGNSRRLRRARSDAHAGCASRRTPTLFVFEPLTAACRQLTFLLDQELAAELHVRRPRDLQRRKARADFHQFAARRQNLDGGDYHPLFAQRPSIGFESATEIIELANRNFALVAAPSTPRTAAARSRSSIAPSAPTKTTAIRATTRISIRSPSPSRVRSAAPGRVSLAGRAAERTLSRRVRPKRQRSFARTSSLWPVRARPGSGATAAHAVAGRIQDRRRASPGLGARAARHFHARVPTRPTPTRASIRVKVMRSCTSPTCRCSATLLFANTRTGRPISRCGRGRRALRIATASVGGQRFRRGRTHGQRQIRRLLPGSALARAHVISRPTARCARACRRACRSCSGSRRRRQRADVRKKARRSAGPMRQREELQFYPGDTRISRFRVTCSMVCAPDATARSRVASSTLW